MKEEEQSISIAATGDVMLSRRVTMLKQVREISSLIKSADAAFANCESLFHNCESYPMHRAVGFGTKMYAEPVLAKEFASLGFTISSLCNNHAQDYGPPAMNSTLRALDGAGVVCAGAGGSLDEAREPKYLETENGRIAIIAACWNSFQEPWERATNMRDGVPPRPGINLLSVDTEYEVVMDQFQTLKRIVTEAGLNPPDGARRESAENTLNFLGRKFKLAEKPGIRMEIKKRDVDDTIATIKDAKRSADWVLMSFHSHIANPKGLEYPPDFICRYARTCVDAGADAFLGHGPHILRGIEIYKQRPIFYSLGNFIAQNLTVRKVTHDQYASLNLDEKAKPSDFYEGRTGVIPPSGLPYAKWWFEGMVAIFRLQRNGLVELKFYPIALDTGKNGRAHIGDPKLAEPEQADQIAKRLGDLSGPDVQVSLQTGIGRVQIQKS